MKNIIKRYKMSENNSFIYNNNNSNIKSLLSSKKNIHSSSHKRNTEVISDNSLISFNSKKSMFKDNKLHINSFNVRNTVFGDSVQNNEYRKNINSNSIPKKKLSNKNIFNNKYKNNNIYMTLSLNNSKTKLITIKNKITKNNTIRNVLKRNRNPYGLFLDINNHHFNSTMNTFGENKCNNSKINIKKKKIKLNKEYFKYKDTISNELSTNYKDKDKDNNNINIILNKRLNNKNKTNGYIILKKQDKNSIFNKSKNENIKNKEIKINNNLIKNNNISELSKINIDKNNCIKDIIPKYGNKISKKKIKINISSSKLYDMKKDIKIEKKIKFLKEKKMLFKQKTKVFVKNIKKNLVFDNSNNNNNKNKTKDKNIDIEYNNEDDNKEENKKKIIVIKKKKKIRNNQFIYNITNDKYNITGINYEHNTINNLANTNNMTYEIIKDDYNTDNNLEIFEIISDAKIKSILEYEKEKNNIQLLKENFNINNNYDKNDYNKNSEEIVESNKPLEKVMSRDTFSFRPTNNDSREICEQDLEEKNGVINNNNNILLEIEEKLKNNEKHRIKIIKKKKQNKK